MSPPHEKCRQIEAENHRNFIQYSLISIQLDTRVVTTVKALMEASCTLDPLPTTTNLTRLKAVVVVISSFLTELFLFGHVPH